MRDFVFFDDLLKDLCPSNKIVLSFDLDWASDEVIDYTYQKVRKAGVKATFFVTHPTPLIERFADDPKVQLGLHPNFNPFFSKNGQESTEESFQYLSDLKRSLLPSAKIIRSHSLTTSSLLLSQFWDLGFEISSNYAMFGQTGLYPFHHPSGIVEMPIFFGDDGYISFRNSTFLPSFSDEFLLEREFRGFRNFNFHPIHIALNTSALEQYEDSREYHHDLSKILAGKISGQGVESFFEKLIYL
tara:strand:+ start:6915 stop:7643 length:729 start_codon:yes stop_codon:yes gene_type:complete